MPISRLAAGTEEMSLPSTSTEPVSAISKPATMRSAVVLPQPDGPSSATSSPGAISRDMPSRALVAPKARVRFRRDTLVPSRPPGPPRSRWRRWSSLVSYRLAGGRGEQVDLAAAGAAGLAGSDQGDRHQQD